MRAASVHLRKSFTCSSSKDVHCVVVLSVDERCEVSLVDLPRRDLHNYVVTVVQ